MKNKVGDLSYRQNKDVNLISHKEREESIYLPMAPFKGTRYIGNEDGNNTNVAERKSKKIGEKETVVSFDEEVKSSRPTKYDSSEMMARLESFSDVWNDCSDVQNLKHSYNSCLTKREPSVFNNFGGNDYSLDKINKNKSCVNNSTSLNTRTKVNKSMDVFGLEPCKVYSSKTKSEPSTKERTDNGDVSKSNITSLNSIDSEINPKLKPEKYDSKIAELKRKKSVLEQRQLHVDKKNIIKQALSSLDGKQQVNTKILFSDTEEQENDRENFNKDSAEKTSKRIKLFDDAVEDESGTENDFTLNHQFGGRKGQKLLELQTKYGNDFRFKLDSRFRESDSDDSDTELPQEVQHDDEKKRQLTILESIVKKPIKTLSEIKKTSLKNFDDKMMLRFDPTREDHGKYIVKAPEQSKVTDEVSNTDTKKKKSKNKLNETKAIEEKKILVSGEKFVDIKKDMKEVLNKDSGKEFSLLKIFGSKETDKMKPDEEQSHSLKKVKHSQRNPFKYDSSESEPEQEIESVKGGKNVKQSLPAWTETFFLKENDPRLKEAQDFLKCSKDPEDSQEYAEKRKMLKNFIRHKLKNNSLRKKQFKKKLGGLKKKRFQKKKAKSS